MKALGFGLWALGSGPVAEMPSHNAADFAMTTSSAPLL